MLKINFPSLNKVFLSCTVASVLALSDSSLVTASTLQSQSSTTIGEWDSLNESGLSFTKINTSFFADSEIMSSRLDYEVSSDDSLVPFFPSLNDLFYYGGFYFRESSTTPNYSTEVWADEIEGTVKLYDSATGLNTFPRALGDFDESFSSRSIFIRNTLNVTTSGQFFSDDWDVGLK